jgi:transposase
MISSQKLVTIAINRHPVIVCHGRDRKACAKRAPRKPADRAGTPDQRCSLWKKLTTSSCIKWNVAETLRGFRQKFRRLVKKGFEENPLPVMVEMPKKRGRRKKSKSRNWAERFAAFEDEILAFAEDFNIPFDNNQAERDLRMMKLQQKISGCFRSRAGAFCRIRGYISTNKKQGVNVLAARQNAFLWSSTFRPCFIAEQLRNLFLYLETFSIKLS